MITTDLNTAARGATIIIDSVTVVALLTQPDLGGAITTELLQASRRAAIARSDIPVIAFLVVRGLHRAVATGGRRLGLTGRAAAIPRGIVAVIALFTHQVLDDVIAAVLAVAVRITAVAGSVIPVVTFLRKRLSYKITAELLDAACAAPVVRNSVTIVTLLAGLGNPVAARSGLLGLASAITTVAINDIPVITALTEEDLGNVIAAVLVLTGRVAAVTVRQVTVIASLIVLHNTIATAFVLAGSVTAVAGNGIPVVTLLAGIYDSVATRWEIFEIATRVATVPVHDVSVIALLPEGGLYDTVATALEHAECAATITVGGVAVVALFPGLLDTITAHLADAACAAPVVGHGVAVVTLLTGIGSAIAAEPGRFQLAGG